MRAMTALAIFVSLLMLALPQPAVEAQATGLTFKVMASPAPNRHSTLGLPYYNIWAGRALEALRQNKGSIGSAESDPAAFITVGTIKPREFLVTRYPSWRGKTAPSAPFDTQYGNRVHFVLHVQGDGSVRFKYEDIRWDYYDTGGWFVAKRSMNPSLHSGYTNAFNRVDDTYGFGWDWGADRKKGGGDDVKVFDSDTTLVDELYYVGAGLGFTADFRYNKPVDFPQFLHLSHQDWIFIHCDYFNSDSNFEQVGMYFHIDGDDGVTYSHLAKYDNEEWAQELDHDTCELKGPAYEPATTTATVSTGAALQSQGYTISAQHGLDSGVQAQQIDESAVGIQSVIDAGFIDGVNVWGYAEQTVEVCFPQSEGALVFLDTSTIPTTVSPMTATVRNGMICGTSNGPGSIILVESWPGSETSAAVDNERSLTNCMVTTTHSLNFRDGPGGSIIGGVPYDATLTAVARTDDWFKVDYHGVKGWISAQYVTKSGDCG